MRLLLLALLLLPLPLMAQDQASKARRIVEAPEYQGYRVERARDFGVGEPDQVAGSGGGSGSGSGSARGEDRSLRRGAEAVPSRPRSESPQRQRSSVSAPAWLGTLMLIIIWTVVIAAGIAALYFIVRALLRVRLRRKPKPKVASKAGATAQEVAPAEAPEAADEFVDALARARQEYEAAVAAQDWARAALLAYRIFWLNAGWSGCVEDEDVRTWRDALRLVRAAETRSRLRELLALVEGVRYGRHVPARDEFERWKSSLDRMEPRGALQ
jgi:hypothetical protein